MSGDVISVSKSFGLRHSHGDFPGKGERWKMSEYNRHFRMINLKAETLVSASLVWFCNSYKQNCSQVMQTKATAGTGNTL